MQKDSTQYMFKFALLICICCSIALALVSEGLRSKKELNVALDVKKNILKAVSLKEPLPSKPTAEQIISVYESKIRTVVLDELGQVMDGKRSEDIKEDEKAYSLYIYEENGVPLAYCFPIHGKGLWSTIYGYLAVENDAQTIRGITFYKHGETPGLGGEVEKAWFQDNFKGKKIYDAVKQELRPTAVVKGKVDNLYKGSDKDFYVDGISGATITSRGVTQFIAEWLEVYEPFLKTIRK